MPYDQSETNTVFIVEDDNANGVLLSEIILQETTCQALLLVNAFQVLKVAQHMKPLLFIIDYRLPNTNGLELYDRLHSMEGLENVPALILGASLEEYEKEIEKRGLVSLRKPFAIEKLLAIIEKLLGHDIRQPEQALPYMNVAN